jgi:hypothetical protein
MTDQTHVEEEYEEVPLARYVAIAAVVALVVAAGAFFAGKAAAGDGGPSTLAAAVSQARAGKLPCGATAAPAAAADFLVAAVCDRNGQTGFRRSGGPGFGLAGPGGAAGTIASIDGSTLTIQGRQGTQKVTLGSATRVRRYATGSKADLKTGAGVIVSGGRNGAPRTVTVLPASQSGQ